jgi:hypothetical protein
MRQKNELRVLYLLLKDVEFFKNIWEEMSEENQIDILQEFQYEFVPRGKAVFKHGNLYKFSVKY